MTAPQIRQRQLRIVIVNDVWYEGDELAGEVLDRFTTLTGWAGALHRSGADVVVFQRFHGHASLERGGVRYVFVADDRPARPATFFSGSGAMCNAVVAARPSAVHVNGLDYPRAIRRLRRALPAATAVAVQDHGGFDPLALSPLRRRWLKFGLRYADALLVSTPDQAAIFRTSGLVPSSTAIHDVMESSTDLRCSADDRDERSDRPFSALWVGRLNANKDPLTVLEGFAHFAGSHPAATLTFVYGTSELERPLREAIDTRADLRDRIFLAGRVPHDALPSFYRRADVLVLGSRTEGSGFAVLEALACGVVPVVTDIPAFRGLTDGGRVGSLWAPGDAAAFSAALTRVAAAPLEPQRDACRRLFEERFSWSAIADRAMAIYRELCG